MEVRYVLLARYAEMALDGTISMIGGALENIPAPTVPYPIPTIYFAAKIALSREETREQHVLGIRVIRPDGSELASVRDIAVPSGFELAPEKNFMNANTIVALQGVVLETYGVYLFQLLYDGEVAKDARLVVEPVEPNRVTVQPDAKPEGQQ